MKSIPSVGGLPPEIARPLEAIKESIEQMRGERGGKIKPLSNTATTSEIIQKINELITRLQG